ncbi:MAG: hypothetical protein P8X96_17030 [Desulfobacteraceae bacterium]|jgi:hypothetical protein
MRKLIERLKSEKSTFEKEINERYESDAEGREKAFNTGKAVAKTWIKNSSYQVIKDVLHRQAAKRKTNSFGTMRHIYFASIEDVCPEEAQKFKWVHNDSFMNGWREGVFLIWDAIRGDVDDESNKIKRKMNS